MGTVSKLKQLDCFKEEKDKEVEKLSRANRSEFDWFWEEYPEKKAKLEALKAWKQMADFRPEIEEIIAAINRQKNSRQWIDGFIPYPATWLRQGRWDDE